MADQWDITVFRGQATQITVTRSVGVQNISGWNLLFAVKQKFTDTVALLTKTSGAGIQTTDTVNGIYVITLTATDTLLATIPVGTYRFDIWRTDVSSEDALAYGRYIVRPSVRVN